jgi:BirA family biotin operon repressor/biotin-[acetyl-CoA-carboxylase] ligase
LEKLTELKRYFDNKNNVFFEHFTQIGSTNTYLKEKATNINQKIHVALSDKQTLGRGRSGRSWYSPDAGNLYISFKFKLSGGLAPLSLIAGAEICQIINRLSKGNVVPCIKWPNDILLDNKKVAGILVETEQDNQSFTYIVGIGINFLLPEQEEDHWGVLPKVNNLNRVAIAKELSDFFLELTYKGIPKAWKKNWEKASIHSNKAINLITNNGEKVNGIYQGITKNGSLIILTENGLTKEFASGECSLNY